MKGDYEGIECYFPDEELLYMAQADIAALLWLDGECKYCKYGHREEYSGAERFACAREDNTCRPKWRYERG